MSSAIKACMPTTLHRWSIWHIMKKIPQKLNGFKGHIEIEHEMTKSGIEAQFQQAYTNAKFKEVQAQFREKVNCVATFKQRFLGCPVLTAMVHRSYDKLEVEMKEYKAQNNGQAIITHQDGSLSEMNDLQSPTHVRSRGRPKKRLGSNMEKQIASNIKKRKAQSKVEGSTT
ncbi:hypothetical protein PIB30_093339 [Stylosanthes scabra]|uniref:Protein FAR1-RELATED SEQUENCE n=1 Tax=Stylosanthes scabra TaxID=79078 RepID=A0ABU6VYD2_9FABA|nr:hypothetical protein [Stylosanthes scabra]